MYRLAAFAILPVVLALGSASCRHGRIDVDIHVPIPTPTVEVPLVELVNYSPRNVTVYAEGYPQGLRIAPWSRKVLMVPRAPGGHEYIEVMVVKEMDGFRPDIQKRTYKVPMTPMEPIPVWIL